MWDWLETLGRTALRAAPYIAAPVTGGASLLALPATNMAADAWGRSDVRQGEGQQGFERWASPISNIAAIGAPFTGGYGLANLGRSAAMNTPLGIGQNMGVPNIISPSGQIVSGGAGGGNGFMNFLRSPIGQTAMQTGTGMLGNYFANQNQAGQYGGGVGPYLASYSGQSGVMPRGGYRYNQNPMNQLDQSSPNLAQSIFQGRQDARRYW